MTSLTNTVDIDTDAAEGPCTCYSIHMLPVDCTTGIFAEIGGVVHNTMVDSGAALSLISKSFWEKLGRPSLTSVLNVRFKTANNTFLVPLGSLTRHVKIGGAKCVHTFTVVDSLIEDVILGADFFKMHQCRIDYVDDTFFFGKETVKLFTQRCDTFAPLKVACSTSVPPMCEVHVNVFSGDVLKNAVGHLVTGEPSLNYKIGSKLLVASCITDPEKLTYAVRIMNISEETVSLNEDEAIGKVETIQSSHSYESETSNNEIENSSVEWEKFISVGDLENVNKVQLYDLLDEYRSIFAFSKKELGKTSVVHHRIDTKDHPPIRLPVRRMPHAYKPEVEEQLEWLMNKEIIRPSSSPWAAPIVMVQKKDGSLRMCIDYRKLNSISVKDSFPLPNIEETFDAFFGSKYFSTMDLASGYW